MIRDIDGTPLAVGDRVLHIVDELEWRVYGTVGDGAAPAALGGMRLFLTREPDEKSRRALMCAIDGTGFRRLAP